MDKLKVLVATNYGSLLSELSNFQLLASLSDLKRIRLDGISIPSITNSPIQLMSLQKISLVDCDIGHAFSNSSIKFSDAFPVLQELDIDNCENLWELPSELCDLTHLSELSIIKCEDLSALAKRIGNLDSLQVLRLRSCRNLLKLPSSMRKLKKLNFLELSACFNIQELPKYIGEVSSLKKLIMRNCPLLYKLPESIWDLAKLEEVVCDDVSEQLWKPVLPILQNISMVFVPETGILFRLTVQDRMWTFKAKQKREEWLRGIKK